MSYYNTFLLVKYIANPKNTICSISKSIILLNNTYYFPDLTIRNIFFVFTFKNIVVLLFTIYKQMEDYLIGIGKRLKEIRKSDKKTINDIATKAGVSNGLISRIENGRTIPSLPVLLNIINALDIEIPAFFNGMPSQTNFTFLVTRASEYSVIEKEDDAIGFSYKYIFGKQLSSIGFEAVFLEVQPGSERNKVETDAYEFKYILTGECHYIIGDEEVLLKEGDSIFFDGRIPHVPVNRGETSSKMIVLYFFLDKGN